MQHTNPHYFIYILVHPTETDEDITESQYVLSSRSAYFTTEHDAQQYIANTYANLSPILREGRAPIVVTRYTMPTQKGEYLTDFLNTYR